METLLPRHDIYPGYPEERLVLPLSTPYKNFELDLPDGPWTSNNTPLPRDEEVAQFIDSGLTVDSLGRPLHPDLATFLHNPEKGVVTGKGFYWHWGPNRTADPIVIRQTADGPEEILLVLRKDTKQWALPGGFIDPGEDPIKAAVREVKEETTLDIQPEGRLVYQGVVSDRRTTAHAWAETTAVLFEVETEADVRGADDAEEAQWFPLSELPEVLHGSHRPLIERALTLRERSRQLEAIMDDDEYRIEETRGGHMAYDHRIARGATKTLFIKSHDATRFTDPHREAHSRQYLEKEFLYLTHVAHHAPDLVPSTPRLIHDTDLIMDGLHEGDGWLWRMPESDGQQAEYLEAVLTALSRLSALPLPEDRSYQQNIRDTFGTHWREGWGDITRHETFSPVIERARSLSLQWQDERRQAVERLITALPDLFHKAVQDFPSLSPTHLAHHDVRQSNIAWHPENGVRLVDWSWADPGLKNADTSTFLIDLKKSGYAIEPYMDHFNQDHALLMIGFWLGHTLWETRDASTTVREQQLASACAAFEILDYFSSKKP